MRRLLLLLSRPHLSLRQGIGLSVPLFTTLNMLQSKVFGSVLLDGVQAEYCLVPLADTTLVKAPPGLAPEVYLLVRCLAEIYRPVADFAREDGRYLP